MPDNPQPPSAPFRLPGIRVLDLEGRDAADFAHAQFMNDVAALPDGHWQWNGWLTPKGRVTALFALLRLDASHVRLAVLNADPDALADRLRPFVFRRKVTFAAPSVAAVGEFAADDSAHGGRIGRDGDAMVLDWSFDGCDRTLRLVADTAAHDNGESALAWTARDLDAGLPRFAPADAERWTPQQLSLERLSAFSVKKGCYPGQEIVARTHFLGQAKRGLALFRAERDVDSHDPVTSGESTWGDVVAVAGDRVLAVGPRDTVPADASIGRASLRAVPLKDGLAR